MEALGQEADMLPTVKSEVYVPEESVGPRTKDPLSKEIMAPQVEVELSSANVR